MAGLSFSDKVNDFCDQLRQRRVNGSLAAAKGTAELMRILITSSRYNEPYSLLDEVRNVGNQIQSAKPIELVIGNVVRRVMHIIREEMQEEPEEELVDPVVLREVRPVAGGLSKALGKPSSTNSKTWGRSFSLHNLLDQLPEDESSSDERDVTQPLLYTESAEKRQLNKVSSVAWDRKQAVIDGVNELIEDLKEIDAAIALHASEHIHANEIILTFGFSRTVAQFLRRAREKRDFQTVVAEGAPTLQGHAMAAELARFGIRTTAIADAAIYAMMARVNKVVISAHALLADGGVMAPVGTAAVAIAAKRHNVPFVVLAGMYKLSPVFPHEPGVTFNDFKEPWEVLPFTDPASLAAQLAEMATAEEALKAGVCEHSTSYSRRPFLQIHNPSYDYIPPELVSLFLTDEGHGFMPSYVYRQLSELYHRQDFDLQVLPARNASRAMDHFLSYGTKWCRQIS